MGWSWAVFLAHNLLTDIIDDDGDSQTALVQHGKPTPQYDRFSLIRWLYIDDYTGAILREEKSLEGDLVEYAARDRNKLNQAGFPVHKEQIGIGMQEGLGLSIGEDLRLTVTAEKMKKLVLSTEALAMHPTASPRLLARLLGQWTWAMMLHRCALALFHQAFRFLQAYDQWDTPGASGSRCRTSSGRSAASRCTSAQSWEPAGGRRST